MRVLVFGSFDPLHKGHCNFIVQARDLGVYVMVVVARDSSIARLKNREPFSPQHIRMQEVALHSQADEVILGDEHPQKYELLRCTDFDILALGYDQQFSNSEAESVLHSVGKQHVKVVRLRAFKPNKYKSSIIRDRERLRH